MITVEHGLGKKPNKMYLLPYEIDASDTLTIVGTFAHMMSTTSRLIRRKIEYNPGPKDLSEYAWKIWNNYNYILMTFNDLNGGVGDTLVTYDEKVMIFKSHSSDAKFPKGTYLWVAISED